MRHSKDKQKAVTDTTNIQDILDFCGVICYYAINGS